MANNEGEELVQKVSRIVEDVVRRAVQRQCEEATALEDPFLARLLSDERFVQSTRFERSLRSSLGSAGYEEIARVVAEHAGARAKRQAHWEWRVTQGQRRAIDELLERRGSKENPLNWERELEFLERQSRQGPGEKVTATVDLELIRDDRHLLFFMKTVKPNLDQTREAKRQMLYAWAHWFNTGEPRHLETYFALAYNPFGEGEEYTWRYPWRYFDMHKAPVLIGRAFWDLLGGGGTYELVLRGFELAGERCRDLIEQFFGRSRNRGG